jgi:H+/Cl- antiporter ClcA
VLTGLILATVQPYFIHRCWRIYQRRVVLTIPLLLLWIASSISGILIVCARNQLMLTPKMLTSNKGRVFDTSIHSPTLWGNTWGTSAAYTH